MLLSYQVLVRDHGILGDDRVVGISPSWLSFTTIGGVAITPQPTFVEMGGGQYRFDYDVEVSGEAIGQIDMGASLTNGSDRYVDVWLTPDAGRVVMNLNVLISSRYGTGNPWPV